jgi:hypothetical protein
MMGWVRRFFDQRIDQSADGLRWQVLRRDAENRAGSYVLLGCHRVILM